MSAVYKQGWPVCVCHLSAFRMSAIAELHVRVATFKRSQSSITPQRTLPTSMALCRDLKSENLNRLIVPPTWRSPNRASGRACRFVVHRRRRSRPFSMHRLCRVQKTLTVGMESRWHSADSCLKLSYLQRHC